MINYVEKGIWLHNAIHAAGYKFQNAANLVSDKDYIVSEEAAIQAIIDAFDPLPFAVADAIKSIKDVSATKRLQYVTDAPGKDLEYKIKQEEADEFYDSSAVGMYMQARMDLTSETALQVADIWNDKFFERATSGASLSAIEDKAAIDLYAETDWTQCSVIASIAIAALEAV